MRRTLALALLLAAVSVAARAQHSHGYLFLAPGGISGPGRSEGAIGIGAGGEGVFHNGVGVGAELGVDGPTASFSDLVGLLSANGYYHPVRSGGRFDPFVTSGYTLLFRTGHANLFNFGGGVNYWFQSKIGLKLEIRDHVHSPSGGAIHYWGVRVGLDFR